MGTALVVWRKNRIRRHKPKTTRTICEVIREIGRDAEDRGDVLTMHRVEEAHDMAKRMYHRLLFYRKFFDDKEPRIAWDKQAGIISRVNMVSRRSVWIGFDPREANAYAVARQSVMSRTDGAVGVHGLVLQYLRSRGLYTRPTEIRDGRLWDVISEAPMSTEFAISRFLTPFLAEKGWALFIDADMLVRGDLNEIFRKADPQYAVMCVKHKFDPPEGIKMDGQAQTRYARKNWSSVMLFNVDHPANERLTVAMVNTLPGRDLHRFCWLEDHEIGELPPEWNFLVGFHDPMFIDPKIVHFTDGIPTMKGYENVPFADEWRRELFRWAS